MKSIPSFQRSSILRRFLPLCLVFFMLAGVAHAALLTYTVTVATDTTTGTAANCTNQSLPGAVLDANCSLRDAIAGANAAVGSTINFAPALTASGPTTIFLVNGSLIVTSSVTITAPAATSPANGPIVIVDGNLISSIFSIGPGTVVSILNIAMNNGRGIPTQPGGALYNQGVLTLQGVLIHGNNSSGYSGGAGIYNQNTGVLSVTQSNIWSNSSSYFGGDSGYGGGILNNGGTVTVTASSILGNQASLGGGNIYAANGTLTIRNTTIGGSGGTQNGGGLYSNGSVTTVIDSTISGNNAGANPGVLLNGTATFTNSIIAGNGGAASTGNCPGCTLLGTSNIVDVDPQLSILGFYGGFTQAYIPLPTSPAICHGTATADTTDQRGYARPTGSCYDVGAVQTAYSMSFQASPTNTPVGATLSPIPDVTVVDHAVNGVPGVSIGLTLSGPGTLSGTLPEHSNSVGNTSFADLSVNTVGTGDTLNATAGGLTAVSNSFNITPLTPTVTFVPNPATQVYGTAIAAGSLDATASYSGNPVAGTFSYTTTINSTPNQPVTAGTTILPGGNYTITATVTPTSANYGPASTTASYSVTPATATLAFTTIPTHTYGDAAFTVAASSAGTGAITYTVTSGPATISGSTLTITGGGTVALHAAQVADGNYAAATANTSCLVTPATATLTFTTIPTHTYGDAAFTVAASSAGTGTVTYTVTSGPATISGNTLTITGAGTVALHAAQAADGNYAAATANTSFLVNKEGTVDTATANPTTALPFQSVTLTATVHATTVGTPTGTVTFYDNGTAIGSAVTLSGGTAQTTTTALAPGQQHTISVSYSGDGNFLASAATASVTTVVTVSPLDFNFTDSGAQSKTVVPGSSVTYTFSVAPISGTYPGPVSFGVTGGPPGATYTFSPATIATNAGPQTVILTVQTVGPTAELRIAPRAHHGVPVTLAFLLLPILAVARRRRLLGRAGRGVGLMLLFAVMTFAAVAGLSGCGAPDGYFGQPIQNYALTVTATSSTVQHTSVVNLQVQ